MSTASEQQASEHIQALIKGQVSGQVAVGKNILMVGPVYGGVVNVAPPGQSAADLLRARPRPVHLLPRPVATFLDRQTEVETLTTHLTRATSVDLYGKDGIGKPPLGSFCVQFCFWRYEVPRCVRPGFGQPPVPALVAGLDFSHPIA